MRLARRGERGRPAASERADKAARAGEEQRALPPTRQQTVANNEPPSHSNTHTLPLLFLLSRATRLFRGNTNDKPAPLRRPPSALTSDDMTPSVKTHSPGRGRKRQRVACLAVFLFFLPLVRANSRPKFVPVLNTGCDVCGHQNEHCASEGFEHAGIPSKYLGLSLDKYTLALYTLHGLGDTLQEGIKHSWHRIRSACTHQEGAKRCVHTWELLGWRIRR